MNCFVIMPFSSDFDDVYVAIKSNVEGALSTSGGRCFRLDEAQPAGRITDRLLAELRAASLCVADLTGNSPNVMWEVGYAMAINKPMVIITQSLKELPFDLKDMQSLEYDRNHLSETLAGPLSRMIIDTVSMLQGTGQPHALSPNPSDVVIAELRDQVSELKSIISQAVRFWNPGEPQLPPVKEEPKNLMSLEGAWFNRNSGSHMYAAAVNGDLVVPYCYNGDSNLTGVYYGWKMVGEYWFARFMWMRGDISGFTFKKLESPDLLTGAWWNDYDMKGKNFTTPPPMTSGVQSTWKRRRVTEYPAWATQFIEEVRQEGLEIRLMRHRTHDGKVSHTPEDSF